ncbi:hypothetical protein P7C71_g5068, partial [Lecanoromycetidae sp. Uapishka_2]
MVVPRTSARWTSRLVNPSTRTARACNRARSWQRSQRRSYASDGDHGGHSSHQSGFLSGDLPWAIGAGIVTIPSVWYLSQPQIERFTNPNKGHGSHGHERGEHDGHGEEDEGGDGAEDGGSGEKGEDSEQDEGQESGEEKSGDQGGEGEGEEEDGSDSEGGNQITPKTPGDKGKDGTPREENSGGNVEGVQFKGAVAGGTKGDNEQGDTRKHIPDAKGGSKKRIESDYAGREGVADKPEQDPQNEDKAAPSKSVDDKSKKSQSGKQEGLSNTDTKHSTDIANSPEKSTKGEGGPETAKNKGTVDPSRPQA